MRTLRPNLIVPLLIATLSSAAVAQDPPSEETIKFFRLNCASCHTIGGGPLTAEIYQR